MMNELVTLIIILHNRHDNLDRLLEYYKKFSGSIIVADSSVEVHHFKNPSFSHNYLYTPGLTFTEKIEKALGKVTTPYVVMCADDDFIVSESIFKCVDFLENNKNYAVAQGICISYRITRFPIIKIEFGKMYSDHCIDIASDDPFLRLQELFSSYRSVMYALHRTDTLKLAFKNAGAVIKNLYLNEYLTALIPLISGKSKELPILYQVREYTEYSDDKTTDNLDKIFIEKKYSEELEQFVQLTANNASDITFIDKKILSNRIYQILEKFSKDPLINNRNTKMSFKKKIGLIVKRMPVVGSWLIEKNRRIEKETEMKSIIKTREDEKHLSEIEVFLRNYYS